MTENTAKTDENAAEHDSALVTVDATPDDAELDLDELTEDEINALADELAVADAKSAKRTGALSGGFGFAGLALAIVSLTTNWTSGVIISHGQYAAELKAPSGGLAVQQELNMYAAGWHTQGLWALAFAAVAVLCGGGALVLPKLRLGTDTTPGWARAAATGAVIVGVVGVVLAILTVVGVFGGHLTAPAATAG